MLWLTRTVQPLPVGTILISEFSGDHHLFPTGSKCFADEFFVGERTIHFSGIEKGDATVHGGPNEGDHFLPVSRWAVVGTHTPYSRARELKLLGCSFQVCVSA